MQHLVVDDSIDARQVHLVVDKQKVLDASLDVVAAPKAPEAPAPVVTLQELAEGLPAPQETVTVPGLIEAFERVGSEIERPRITIGALRVQAAPIHGNRNPGSLYVKRNGEYQGKITSDGVFHPTGYAAKETAEELLAIDEDPVGKAREHGRLTGQCAICSRQLTDPVSVERGIGPICASRWGGEY